MDVGKGPCYSRHMGGSGKPPSGCVMAHEYPTLQSVYIPAFEGVPSFFHRGRRSSHCGSTWNNGDMAFTMSNAVFLATKVDLTASYVGLG